MKPPEKSGTVENRPPQGISAVRGSRRIFGILVRTAAGASLQGWRRFIVEREITYRKLIIANFLIVQVYGKSAKDKRIIIDYSL
jgi:hypothetical protein